MNVGILTFHKAKNYGAVLQLFALQRVLIKLGVNAIIINRYSGYRTIFHKVLFSLYPKVLFERFTWILFNQFSKKHLNPKTKKYTTSKEINHFQYKEMFDACIVGSDQVWRMNFSDIGYNYFLDFITKKNIRKISYAASFGKDKWNENEKTTRQIKKLLKDFHSISVREESGIRICKDNFNVEAIHVLDPTLLLSDADYETTLMKNLARKDDNIMVSYILGDYHEIIDFCNHYACKNSLKYTELYQIYPFYKVFSKRSSEIKHFLHVSVIDWLKQIKSSKYLITNSFHATIFAILFNKQFIVIDHPEGGTSRITSFLEMLKLQDRFFSHISNNAMETLRRPIDFEFVKSKLELEKDKSILFLKNSLFQVK